MKKSEIQTLKRLSVALHEFERELGINHEIEFPEKLDNAWLDLTILIQEEST